MHRRLTLRTGRSDRRLELEILRAQMSVRLMNRAIVPVATMLAIQVMVSLCVLALGVMMPAVAKDLAIDPKLVGVFTAIIYAVAAVTGAGRGRSRSCGWAPCASARSRC